MLNSWHLVYFLLFLFNFIIKIETQQKHQLRSVPIPLYMDNMLSAGRKVYDRQSTPTQNIGINL